MTDSLVFLSFSITAEATASTDATADETYNVHQSTLPLGPAAPPLPEYRAIHSLGVSDELWRYYREMSLESMRQMDPYDPLHKAIPPPYCNAYCLDAPHQRGKGRSIFFGYPSVTFQVTNREDGYLYCLRRFDSVRSVSPKIAISVSELWNGCAAVQEHPGIVPFYQCFVAQRAVFFVHQYVPKAHSLKELLVGGTTLSENILWSCITQLVAAIRTIHRNNLAVRTIRLQYVLSTTDWTNSRLRLRLGCLGVVDALEFESRKHVSDLQTEDMRDFGRLILSLASGTEITATTESNTLARCAAFLAQNYSRELNNLVVTLIRSRPHPPSIMEVSQAIAQYCFDEQDAAYRSFDRIDRSLSAEFESGRALRLLLKLGFINERPEYGPNRRWAHSGDCYVLTLFRDYGTSIELLSCSLLTFADCTALESSDTTVFHQADGAGNPVMDLGHVITALNKLEAADEEKIVLTSRDGKSLMIVSYADVGRCLDSAYQELCSGAVSPAALQFQ